MSVSQCMLGSHVIEQIYFKRMGVLMVQGGGKDERGGK